MTTAEFLLQLERLDAKVWAEATGSVVAPLKGS